MQASDWLATNVEPALATLLRHATNFPATIVDFRKTLGITDRRHGVPRY